MTDRTTPRRVTYLEIIADRNRVIQRAAAMLRELETHSDDYVAKRVREVQAILYGGKDASSD